jgi:hypothetical protein
MLSVGSCVDTRAIGEFDPPLLSVVVGETIGAAELRLRIPPLLGRSWEWKSGYVYAIGVCEREYRRGELKQRPGGVGIKSLARRIRFDLDAAANIPLRSNILTHSAHSSLLLAPLQAHGVMRSILV